MDRAIIHGPSFSIFRLYFSPNRYIIDKVKIPHRGRNNRGGLCHETDRYADQRRGLSGPERGHAGRRQGAVQLRGAGGNLRLPGWLPGPDLRPLPAAHLRRLHRHPHQGRHLPGHQPHPLQDHPGPRRGRRGQGGRHEADLLQAPAGLPGDPRRQRHPQDRQPPAPGGAERRHPAQDHR